MLSKNIFELGVPLNSVQDGMLSSVVASKMLIGMERMKLLLELLVV